MSTQETNGGSSSGVLLNTNKEKGKPGRKRGPVWIHFNDIGTKKEGHISCKCMYCGWTQTQGEPAQMQAHLALSCSKVPSTIKIEYLLLIKQNAEERVTNSTSTVSKKRCVNLSQTRIDKFYESDQIDSTKQVLCDKAVAKFFVCCGVAFHLVSHPFFIDMVKSLCNGYEPPYSTTLSNTLMNNELTKITVDQQLTLDKESDLTLGFDGWTSPRGKGLHPMVFRDVCLNAMKLLKNMGGGENSCSELVAQIRAFTQYEKPYDLEYVLGIDNVFLWWRLCNPVHPEEHYIQQLAMKILSITPHNAGCERVFYIIGWMANKRRTRLNVEKLESMAKLHTYYITNANDYNDEDEDYDQNEDEGDDTEAANNNNLEISRWVNIMDKELQELLQTEVKVVIDISPPPPLVDHGSQEFNMEEVLDRILT
ncbi:unnamed protein product [Rhizophagus irregularis]|uniref:BED-type domain-containing protein n=1 Tax=Rhizophagus irregularis TaxID=588596 RepID=A0A915ZES9_9GLOM|nr:unnamed protein product [Rhizophagus irregularis]